MLFILLSFVLSSTVDFLKFRLRLVVFDVMIWLAKALLRLTFPVPVREKRLAAPRCVFIFGIISPHINILLSLFFGGRHNHNHISTLKTRLLINSRYALQGSLYLLHHLPPDLRISDFTPPEHHRYLHLVTLTEKLFNMLDLSRKIMFLSFGPYPDFLNLNNGLALLGILQFFILLIPILSIIHHSAHRRIGIRSDLDKIEANLLSHG